MYNCSYDFPLNPYKGKGLPQQAEVAQGVPGRLTPRIFLTFVTTRVVGRQLKPATGLWKGKQINKVSCMHIGSAVTGLETTRLNRRSRLRQ